VYIPRSIGIILALCLAASVTGASGVGPHKPGEDPTVGPLVTAEALKSPVGYWKTIDDKTKKPRSIVKVWEQGGELRGRIERLLREPNEEQDPVCDKCKGEKHNKKIIGMEFLWGFKREAAGWSDGWVLDPKDGNTYHATLEVAEGGAKLKLFGYIRILFKIGRSQTWERVRPEDSGV
jgi:uncharacterized protein (DUF2147 family)